MRDRLRTAGLLVVLAGSCVGEPARDDARPEIAEADLLTRAEETGFSATSTYDETLSYLKRLDELSDAIQLTSFGRSAEGRTLPLAIVSAGGAFTPGDARASGKPVVLVQSGIHAGEIDGKDASLILLREIALGRRDELAAAGTLLFAPIYNADGHERVSPFNRPNQNGPVDGMGFRTTASGLDLNRDHMKLDSAEARALIRLVGEWGPHLHVDDHVTNGVDHEWVLTYSHAEAPQIAGPVDAWLGDAIPRVARATRAAGHPTGPYVSLLERLDPTEGFSSWVGQPRYSTGYFALRGIPSILVEMHSYKPYEQRVRANHDFLVALVEEVARSGDTLVRAVGEARARTTALGRVDAEPSRVDVLYEADDTGDTIEWPVYAWSVERSPVLGDLLRFERGVTRPIEVRWVHRARVALDLPRPRGYLVMPGWPQITERLLAHGLRVLCTTADAELEVETIRIAEPEFAQGSYQGRHRVTAETTRQSETRTVPAGALWVPADQPDFEIAVQLLEPEAADSLFSWGHLSSVVERKEYIGAGELDDLAREMLGDPDTRAAWEARLEDPAFASDRGAKYLWWYRRTPHWDETVGLMPVMRVMSAPEFAVSARRR